MLWSTCKFSFQFSQVYFMRITWWDYFKCPNSWALTKETGYYVETEYFCYIKYDGNQFPQAEYQVAKELSLPDPWRGRWVQLTSIRGWTPTIKTSDRYPMLLIWDTHFDWMIMLTLIFPDQTSTLPLSLSTKYTHWILFLSHGWSNTTVYHMFFWICKQITHPPILHIASQGLACLSSNYWILGLVHMFLIPYPFPHPFFI